MYTKKRLPLKLKMVNFPSVHQKATTMMMSHNNNHSDGQTMGDDMINPQNNLGNQLWKIVELGGAVYWMWRDEY